MLVCRKHSCVISSSGVQTASLRTRPQMCYVISVRCLLRPNYCHWERGDLCNKKRRLLLVPISCTIFSCFIQYVMHFRLAKSFFSRLRLSIQCIHMQRSSTSYISSTHS